MGLGHVTGMPDIRELVEALPECEPKGRLRGLATVAEFVEESTQDEILSRMAAVVRDWRDKDPLLDLSRELERRLGSRPDR